MMAKIIDTENNEAWHKVLYKVEYTMNNTRNRSTNECPSVMLFGVKQKGNSVDSLKENVIDPNNQTIRNLEEIRRNAQISQEKAQAYNNTYVKAKRKKPKVFAVGDYVVVKNFNSLQGASSKLIPKFKGPYVVSKVLDNDRYLIEDVENFQQSQIPYSGIWAVHNLKQWINSKSVAMSENELSEENDEDNEENIDIIPKNDVNKENENVNSTDNISVEKDKNEVVNNKIINKYGQSNIVTRSKSTSIRRSSMSERPSCSNM
jgi:sporulation protein YlmC with PRC-barrel domain